MNGGGMVRTKGENNTIFRILKVSAAVCFVVAAVLVAVTVLLQIESIRAGYDEYLSFLSDFENRVAALRSRGLILVVIALLFLLRSLSMIYPYALIYITTIMVFSPVESFFINLAGMAFTFAFRYYTGVEMGEGTINYILKKRPFIMSAIEAGGRGNSVVVLALRMIPALPINTISHLYGSVRYPFARYMLLSLAAFVPKLLSYSLVGGSVYDPLSPRFFVPFIILLVFTGICLIVFSWMLKIKYRFFRKTERKENA